ncbi:hypothetical protein, partial [Desulfacinum hydrothermale]|uniref:hypothetical protein n=1 Tax=Desulfacinum hydrothermale TaxID=109258 RepID=UPI001BAFF209
MATALQTGTSAPQSGGPAGSSVESGILTGAGAAGLVAGSQSMASASQGEIPQTGAAIPGDVGRISSTDGQHEIYEFASSGSGDVQTRTIYLKTPTETEDLVKIVPQPESSGPELATGGQVEMPQSEGPAEGDVESGMPVGAGVTGLGMARLMGEASAPEPDVAPQPQPEAPASQPATGGQVEASAPQPETPQSEGPAEGGVESGMSAGAGMAGLGMARLMGEASAPEPDVAQPQPEAPVPEPATSGQVEASAPQPEMLQPEGPAEGDAESGMSAGAGIAGLGMARLMSEGMSEASAPEPDVAPQP